MCKRHPFVMSFAVVLVFILVQILSGLPAAFMPELLENMDLYLVQLLAETACLIALILLALIFRMGRTFRPSGRPLHTCLVPCLALILIYGFAMAEELIFLERPVLRPPLNILWFVLCMLAVGLTEELAFRGLILRMLYERFGRTSVGLWLSVLASSLLFGAIHLTNLAAAELELSAVMAQVAGAAAIGICMGAIYLRTRSYWTVALLHGFMDFCGLAASGLFGQGNPVETLEGYGPANLLGAAIYLVVGLFLMRPSKVRTLTDPKAETPWSHVGMLMAVLVLYSGLIAAAVALLV